MNKYSLTALSVCGGVLSGLAWTEWCPGLILLFSFVPFFIIENLLYENRRRYSPNACFLYLLPGFVIFSILTLGWIRAISMTAAICVILIAALLMAFTMWLAHRIRLREGDLQGYMSIIAFWLTLEFLCLRIPVLSPWLNLGNGLSKDILFIQWYEVTGTAGGTLWILLSNLFLFRLLVSLFTKNRKRFLYLSLWLIIILIPSIISVIRYRTINPSSGYEEEVVIVQPNFDPYEEKYTVPFEKQLEKVISMAEPVVSDNTDWLVTPETTIDDPADENMLTDNKYVKMIRDFIEKRPSVSVVTGMVSFSSTSHGTIIGSSSDTRSYYNSALKIDTGAVVEIYHKSKLVPGFEFIPSQGFFGLISRFLPELGGLNRGYSTQDARTCFENADKSKKIAPVICYESVFGEYITDYIRDGAGAIFIITNDGWWKNTIGYKQHLTYSSLRAIETRRPVIRSANTGISCFIDIRGKIIQKTEWWTPSVIKGTFNYEDRITPYVRFGDYLLYMACVISILILGMIFVFRPFRNKTKMFNKVV
jgi:apolipoprotein N-acyltransferase